MSNPSGGIKYLARALINRKRWEPFRHFVDGWLMDWSRELDLAKCSKLVLIGPNAGHTLSKEFLKLFQNITVIEPDPLAYCLLEARFLLQARWERTDYFGLSKVPPNPNGLIQLFSNHPNSVFLFCNMLGQLPVILRERLSLTYNAQEVSDMVDKYMDDLGLVFQSRHDLNIIGSYHDRFSRDLKNPHEIIDHLTGGLFQNFGNRREFPWRLTGREEHQIEFIHNSHRK